MDSGLAVLGFIFGSAAGVFAVLSWGLAGTAHTKAKKLEGAVHALEQRLAQLENKE